MHSFFSTRAKRQSQSPIRSSIQCIYPWISIYMYISVYLCLCISMNVYIYVYLCMSISIYLYVYIYVHPYVIFMNISVYLYLCHYGCISTENTSKHVENIEKHIENHTETHTRNTELPRFEKPEPVSKRERNADTYIYVCT